MYEAVAFTLAIPIIVIIGGLIIGAMALHHQAKLKELAYRERIAMIERGLLPTPESDPARFERTIEQIHATRAGLADVPGRHRTAGIVIVGLGLGLLLIITFAAGNPGAGFGVGGAIIVLGAAFLVNAVLAARAEARRLERTAERMPPPSNPVL